MICKQNKKENRMRNYLALQSKHAVHFYLFKGKIRISFTGGKNLHGEHLSYK